MKGGGFPVALSAVVQGLSAFSLGSALVGGRPATIAFCGVAFVATTCLGVVTLRARRRRVQAASAEVRPRFGMLRLRSGVEEPVVFLPVNGQPGVFMARHAGDESPVVLRPGDSVCADALGPGQSIVMRGDLTPG